jgi:hypothetical protein
MGISKTAEAMFSIRPMSITPSSREDLPLHSRKPLDNIAVMAPRALKMEK